MEKRITVKEGRRKFTFVYKEDGVVIKRYRISEQEPDVVIPEQIGNRKVIEIAESAFEGNTSIQSVVMLCGIEKISPRSFSSCTNLKHITFPETLEEIQYDAFSGCWNLTDFTLPERLRVIGRSAFSGCKSLYKLVFPDAVETMSAYSFSDCANLEEVLLPIGLKELGNRAFENCPNLKSVHFGNGISEQNLLDMKIGQRVFRQDRLLADSQGNIQVDGVLLDHIGDLLDFFEYPEQCIRMVNPFDFAQVVYRKTKTEAEEMNYEELKQKEKGDLVLFGRFPQDGTFLLKPIQWRVLSKEGNELLLISEKALMHMNYDNRRGEFIWPDCRLRQWLNEQFYEFAFYEQEKQQIQAIPVQGKILKRSIKSQEGQTIDAEDRVTLLTAEEAKMYFDTQEDRVCRPTEYTGLLMKEWANTLDSFGYEASDFGRVWWWLRPLYAQVCYRVPSVSENGFVRDWVTPVDYVMDKETTVRPVIRIKIE